MKFYFAHGHIIGQDATGDNERWGRWSNFSEVFFSFDKAKKYLLDAFNGRLTNIYLDDPIFRDGKAADLDEDNWKGEYVSEYIEYELTISEIDSDICPDQYSNEGARRMEWVLRYTGDIRTRYIVLRDGVGVEFRPSDELPEAGTKYKVGDLVTFNDMENKEYFADVFVITKTPQKVEGGVWSNHYEVAYIEKSKMLRPVVRMEEFHEEDIQPCFNALLEHNPLKEQLLALQKVAVGEIELPEKLREDIFSGKVLFNDEPSWRDIPELK